MGKVPTKINVLTGYTQTPRPQDGQSLDDAAFARGGVIPLGFVPHIKADLPQMAGSMDSQYVVIETNGANDVPVDHQLRRIPRRFTVVNKTVACDVYAGVPAWTDSRAFFRASVAGATVTIELA